MPLRYATWQAVSTKGQAAADKVSLKVQLEANHAAARLRGWVHTHDYTVPGKTRTQWISLYHAEKNISQLHELLEAATHPKQEKLPAHSIDVNGYCNRGCC